MAEPLTRLACGGYPGCLGVSVSTSATVTAPTWMIGIVLPVASLQTAAAEVSILRLLG